MSWSFPDGRGNHDARRLGRLFGGGTSLAVALAMPAGAQTIPRLEVDARVLASENPLLLPGTDRGALLMEVSARPGISGTTQNGSTFDIGGVVTDRGYSRRYGNFVVGSIAGRGDYRDSEYLSLGVSASYSRDVAVDVLTSSVEAAADPAAVRTAYGTRLSLTAHPNEHTWIKPEVGFARASFADTALLGATRTIDGSLSYTRQSSARTRIGARGGAIFSRTGRDLNLSTQLLYATLDQKLSAGWRMTGELGVERNDARVESLLGAVVDQRARLLLSGRAELCRDAPGPAICVRGQLNSEVSGLGGLQRRAVIGGSIRQRLGERNSIEASGDYQRSVMQGDVFPSFDAIRATGLYQRTLGRDLALGGTVQYLRRRLIDGSHIGAAFAGLQLTWSARRR